MIRKRYRSRQRHCIALCRAGGEVARGYNTADDMYARDRADTKGALLRKGVWCSDSKIVKWEKRVSVKRIDQVDIFFDGELVRRTGETRLTGKLRWLRGRNRKS